MAERAEALVLQMSADIRKMEAALAKIAGDTDRQLRRTEQRFDKLNAHIKRSGDQMARDLRTSVAGIAAAFAVRDIAQAADQWTSLRNQVSQYTSVLGPTEAATARLLGVANDAGVAIASLGTTFAASARAAKTLGASGDQVFAFNEAVAKGAQIANTGAAAVDGALTQLGQAIGSPKVQLGEFNSVIEGTPRLAQAFADGIADAGGSIAKLRELISKGEISGGELFQGLLSQLPTLRREFSQSEATIGRSMNKLNNAFIEYVGNADKAVSGTKILNGFITLVADNFELFADAAVVAALAVGGTLAAQAVAKAITGIAQLGKGVREASTAMQGFRAAAAVFGGPIGVLIAGVGGALAGLALSAGKSSDAFDRLESSIEDYKRTQGDIARDTEQLRDIQDRLRDAIHSQGDAAESTARREEVAIARRIAANKQLSLTLRAGIQAQLVEAERALTERSRPGSRLDQFFQLLGAPLEALAPRPDVESLSVVQADIAATRMLEERGPNGTSYEDFMRYVDQRIQQGLPLLSPDDDYIVQLLAKVDQAQARVADLRAQVAALDSGAGPTTMFGDVAGSTAEATAATQGYRTALEALQATLKPLQEARQADLDSLGRQERAYAENLAVQQDAALGTEYLTEQEAALAKAREQANAELAVNSRIAVQAVLAYASASGNLADALRQADEAAGLLTAPDRLLLAGELKRMIDDATAAVATGYARLKLERDAKMAEIDAAMMAALGFDKAGFDALTAAAKRQLAGAADVYLEAFADLERRFQDDVRGLANVAGIGDFATPELDSNGKGPTIADSFASPEALASFEERMADSIKYALRDGILTGDWDQAFRSVLADAVSTGLEGALTGLSNWIAEFLFSPNGFLGSVVNGIGAWAGASIFGGARAAGGPVSAGKIHLVGERGPELFMPSHSGKIINASETNRMLGSIGGGGGGVVVNLNVAGSIDSVTWPKVEAALQATSARLMSAMPTAVRGTIIHDRKQKRRY